MRLYVFHCNESKLCALRVGPWKFHYAVAEDYYGPVNSLSKPMIFNIRMDPFESYDSKDSYGHLSQKVSWLMAPVGEMMQAHLQTLVDYPPVQGGCSFDMSNLVEYFIKGHD